MLSDAQVERYSRQILLPEVGGRGQARLLAARATVFGAGEAARVAATLLGRAGVGTLAVPAGMVLPELSPDTHVKEATLDAPPGDVVVALGATGTPVVLGTRHGSRLVVDTLIGRPCLACRPADTPAVGDAGSLAAPATLALGALAAGEALRVLLETPRAGRRTTVALADGTVAFGTLAATRECSVCGNGT